MTLTYEAWRITYQDGEQAARAAYRSAHQQALRCSELQLDFARVERNRDMYREQVERQAAELEHLRKDNRDLRREVVAWRGG